MLKLNHSDYKDLCILYDNLESYLLSGVPVTVDFKKLDSDGNKISTAISKRFLSIEPDMLESLLKRLVRGERVVQETEAEKSCYSILSNLKYVGGHVKGPLTNKKYMHNEIWSLVYFKGGPSRFIMLSPADSRHPLCLYYADSDTTLRPKLRLANERDSLVLRNPAAAANFFDYVVYSMIKNVLGVGSDHDRLYGKMSAYYSTVE